MNQYMPFITDFLSEVGTPLSALIITIITGYIIRKIVFIRLSRWSRSTKTEIDDIIIGALKGPIIIWFLMLGIFFALKTSKLTDGVVFIINKLLLILGILSITVVLANISSRLIKVFSQRVDSALPVTSLTQNISRIIILLFIYIIFSEYVRNIIYNNIRIM